MPMDATCRRRLEQQNAHMASVGSDAAAITVAQRVVDLGDPHDCTDNSDTQCLLSAIFDALVRPGTLPGEYLPALSRSWEVDAACQTWTFTLRDGVVFHNGEPCEAGAVVFSLRRMAQPDVGATLGAPAVWAQYLGGAVVVATGRLQVRLTTATPCADLLDVLACAVLLPPQLLSTDEGVADFERRPVGTGPYLVAEYDRGSSLLLRAAPGGHFHYGGKAPPHSALRFIQLEQPEARLAALRDGDADIATRLPRTVSSCTNGDTPAAGSVATLELLDPTCIIFLVNAHAGGPCADSRVRQALALALDRPALVSEVLGGAGVPLTGVFSPCHLGAPPRQPYSSNLPSATAGGTTGTTDDSKSLQHNRAKAKALLAEAGYDADDQPAAGKGRLTLSVSCPSSLPDEAELLTQVLASQLATIGITLEVTVHHDRVAYAHMVGLYSLCCHPDCM